MANDFEAQNGFVGVKTINNQNNILLQALQHNARALPERTHIDPHRSHFNYSLTAPESPADTIKRVKIMLINEDIKTRKDASMAYEIVFSAPPKMSDTSVFFVDCFEWVKSTRKGVLLSFVVHLDEARPHAHAVILGLHEGKLSARAIVGGRGGLFKIQAEFIKDVGQRYGLKRAKRLTSTVKIELYQRIIHELESNKDPVLKSSLWATIRDTIRCNPAPYAESMGIITAPKKAGRKPKTFTEIMTQPKPENKKALSTEKYAIAL